MLSIIESNYYPAPNYLRRLARTYDWFIMSVLSIATYTVAGDDSIFNKKAILAALAILFYVLIYSPIMDFMGGTVGKRVAGLRIIDYAVFNRQLSIGLVQAYKRSFLAAWPMIILAIVLIFWNSGYNISFDIEFSFNRESSFSVMYFICIALLVTQFVIYKMTLPEVKRKQTYGKAIVDFNNGQGQHDFMSRTLVAVERVKNDSNTTRSILNFQYENPTFIFKAIFVFFHDNRAANDYVE